MYIRLIKANENEELSEQDIKYINENVSNIIRVAEEAILSGSEEQYIKKSDEFFKAMGKQYKLKDISDFKSRSIALKAAILHDPIKAYKVLVKLGHIWELHDFGD